MVWCLLFASLVVWFIVCIACICVCSWLVWGFPGFFGCGLWWCGCFLGVCILGWCLCYCSCFAYGAGLLFDVLVLMCIGSLLEFGWFCGVNVFCCLVVWLLCFGV